MSSATRFMPVLAAVFGCVAGAQADVVMDWVTVGDPGNAEDIYGYGSVAYEFDIGKYEVTAGQYTEFLNAVAATDTYGLYSTQMWSHYLGCKIQRSGSSGSYTYSVAGDWADRPVGFVSWGDAARFCNWLENGQPTGAQDLTTTEDGSYYLNGATSDADLMAVSREPGAVYVISSEDEWYKAAYYDGLNDLYYIYPTGTDATPSHRLIDPDPGNNANFYDPNDGGYTIGAPYYRTEVGEFENSESPYGTFDQGGNVWEWTEEIVDGSERSLRGGSCGQYAGVEDLRASERRSKPPTLDDGRWGFRVARIPGPATLSLDIMPGLCPNRLDRTSLDFLPLALVGKEDFDVTEIDPSSVLLSRSDGVGGAVAPNEGPSGPHSEIEDVATPFDGEPCDCHGLEGDGILDLSMSFCTDDVVTELELDDLNPGDAIELVVTGSLIDGTEFISARDCVLIVLAEVLMDWALVSDPGNPVDVYGYGGVGYEFNIGKYEVTAGQYVEFLNAVAATDTYGLYNTQMWTNDWGCKIQRSGSSGSYTYSVAADRADRPANFVSWADAARFCNWLENGQPTGAQDLTTTEDGSYYLNGATSDVDLMAVSRKPGAAHVIPSEDEWYKAAYYDGPNDVYYMYPTGTDATPSNDLIDPDPGNNANFYDPDDGGYTIGAPYFCTVVGEFENSESPYGTFDQGGNVWEWTELIVDGWERSLRGGSWGPYAGVECLRAAEHRSKPPTFDHGRWGFRVVRVPEPTTLSLDIKPGSCPNPLNRASHGVLPVAVVGREDFDVTEIDLSSVLLSRTDGVGGAVAPNEGPSSPHSEIEDVATPFDGEPCDCHGLEGDGILDLSMNFRTDDVVAELELDDLNLGDEIELVVTGGLIDATQFIAGDCVVIVPYPGSPDLTVMSAVSGLFVEAAPMDLTIDGGGFGNFERAYDPGTTITLTAPASFGGRLFGAWEVDGLLHTRGQTVINVTIDDPVTARPLYRPLPPKQPGTGAQGGPTPFER